MPQRGAPVKAMTAYSQNTVRGSRARSVSARPKHSQNCLQKPGMRLHAGPHLHRPPGARAAIRVGTQYRRHDPLHIAADAKCCRSAAPRIQLPWEAVAPHRASSSAAAPGHSACSSRLGARCLALDSVRSTLLPASRARATTDAAQKMHACAFGVDRGQQVGWVEGAAHGRQRCGRNQSDTYAPPLTEPSSPDDAPLRCSLAAAQRQAQRQGRQGRPVGPSHSAGPRHKKGSGRATPRHQAPAVLRCLGHRSSAQGRLPLLLPAWEIASWVAPLTPHPARHQPGSSEAAPRTLSLQSSSAPGGGGCGVQVGTRRAAALRRAAGCPQGGGAVTAAQA